MPIVTRLGIRTAEKLVREIDESKKQSLSRLVFGLGIRLVGEETAGDLANRFGSIKKLAGASREELEKVDEVGPRVSESVKDFFDAKRNQEMIDTLREVSVDPTVEDGSLDVEATDTLTNQMESVYRKYDQDIETYFWLCLC